MRLIERGAWAAIALAFCLIVLGGLVRSTESGLSCPDWPTCYGQWVLSPAEFAAIPDTGYTYGQVFLEWVHRLIAGVGLGPLIGVLAVALLWRRRSDPAGARAAALLVTLLLIQGALGGLTVLDRNSPWSVALHLGNALLLLSTLIWIAVHARPAAANGPPLPKLVLPLAGVAWGIALAAMAAAAMTAKSGASLACASWPSCDGLLVPALDDPLIRIHFIHRVLAASLALTLVGLFVTTRRAPARVAGLGTAALVLVGCQVALGAAVIIFQVPIWQALAHQALGVVTFGTITTLLWSSLRLREASLPTGNRGVAHGYA